MATSNLPSFNVYAVEDRGKDEDPFWLKIGAAFAHKDAKGFNIVLSAFPLDNRLMMRVPADNGENGCQSAFKSDPRSASNFDPLCPV